MARRRTDGGDELPPDIPFPDPDRPGRPRPDTGEGPLTGRAEDIAEARFQWAEAVNFWQIANAETTAQRFANAEVAYEESQKAVTRYFQKFYTTSTPNLPIHFLPGQTTANKLGVVLNVLFNSRDRLSSLWGKVRRRREAITLEELQTLDLEWIFPGSRAPSENA